MTFDSVLHAMQQTLAGPLANPHMAQFGPEAVLNDDLHIDSVVLINLLVHLETDHGVAIPERDFRKEDFVTVADLIHVLLADPPALPTAEPQTAPANQDPSEITVHCFVSCLCAAIRRHEGLDFRPFYFGTWDSDFAVTAQQHLAYHSAEMTQDHYIRWVEQLYGIRVSQWHDPALSKSDNLTRFEILLHTPATDRQLVVMLDMFHLPERDTKYNQDPFPHFVIVEPTADPEVWHMNDPDYRWRGDLPRAAILNAMAQPSVAGGYILDSTRARAPEPQDLVAYFNATFRPDANPLTDALRRIITYHGHPERPLALPELEIALRELPVLSLRKYAYEHAFAFFWRALGLSFAAFDAHCDQVEALCEGFRRLHFQAAKLAHTRDRAQLPELIAALDALDRLEFTIKTALHAQFQTWCRTTQVAASISPNRSHETRAILKGEPA
ncbi:DUF6005 family protein [Phaeobacter inhibens]|uniref:DUF6005 family protein n=1 Tax=Phaeobacter inhibens TaxID=221822 RepID=UPI0001632ACC|nr:DUF6005 family protein [Phaeobacter inhibens]AFO93565.1 hypothetical protein PGA1_78p00440 [Phaeobacter inhibens DSM 17395]AUQ48237.1 acyl carrier protein [Phaeobacter inhibens]